MDDTLEITNDGKEPDECPTCGNEDIQSAELLEAWKKIKDLEEYVEKFQDLPVKEALKNSNRQIITIPPDIDWPKRYEVIKKAYVKTRLEVSGSFGNWDYNTRKRVLENEISSELGFTV